MPTTRQAPRVPPSLGAVSSMSRLLGRVTQQVAGGGEDRPGQQEMVELVFDVVRGATPHLAVEAGTGTGKSLAYLTPLVAGLDTGAIERAVIATATLALQDQLVGSDLPVTLTGLGATIDYSVLKGRSNYLCLQRLDELETATVAEQQQLLVGGDAAEHLPVLRSWAASTATGDREELVPAPPAHIWRAVSVGPDECPGAGRCPRGAECFAEQARAAATESQLIVTNHHYYGLHMAAEGTLLPPHDIVVFDEAHHLADVISATTGVELGGGRFRTVARRVRSLFTDDDLADLLIRSADDIPAALADDLGRRIAISAELMATLLAGRSRADSAIHQLRSIQKSDGGGGESIDVRTSARIERALRMLGSLVDDIDLVLEADEETHVLWVDGTPSNPRLRATSIDVGPICASRLWAVHRVVLTSATLPDAIGAGLGHPDLPVRRLGSPFDYSNLGMLYCPLHLPEPRDPAYPDASRAELVRLVQAAGGRALCLFTSYRAMEAAAGTLRDQLEGIEVLVQGEESKTELLRRFVDQPRSALLATLSFWQGVDLPGDDLTLVAIDRLPFPRPDDPVLSARRDRAGRNAFGQIDLPRATTLLAQAAGRLIRRADDRGVVAVLDRRLATSRSYRWEFINALPPFARTRDPDAVIEFLRSLDSEAPPSHDTTVAGGPGGV